MALIELAKYAPRCYIKAALASELRALSCDLFISFEHVLEAILVYNYCYLYEYTINCTHTVFHEHNLRIIILILYVLLIYRYNSNYRSFCWSHRLRYCVCRDCADLFDCDKDSLQTYM